MQTISDQVVVENIYKDVVKSLSPHQRLELAALLLNGIVKDGVDARDEWSDEDLRDFSAASLRDLDD